MLLLIIFIECKLSGYDKFCAARKDIMNELKPIYEVLTQAIKFQEITLELLLKYDELSNFKVIIYIIL